MTLKEKKKKNVLAFTYYDENQHKKVSQKI